MQVYKKNFQDMQKIASTILSPKRNEASQQQSRKMATTLKDQYSTVKERSIMNTYKLSNSNMIKASMPSRNFNKSGELFNQEAAKKVVTLEQRDKARLLNNLE